MISVLRYGEHASLELELTAEAVVAHCDAPRGEPLSDVPAAVEGSLAEPLEYPPLARAVVPGDKVVLAVAGAVPGLATIVERTVDILVRAGIDARDITLLSTKSDHAPNARDALAALPDSIGRAIHCEVHDPADRDRLSYLAASTDAQPIYINRAIHDADLVVTVGCLRTSESLGYHGISSTLFPAFSDTASVERYRSPKLNNARHRERLDKDASEVTWLLGMRFTIQVVPGAGGDVLHVLAGDIDAVFREGSRLCDEAWSFQVPQRAELIVTTIEGPPAEQTWENVARALAAAAQAAEPDAAVVVCSELAQQPGAALAHAARAENLDAVLRALDRARPADALAASEVVRALQRGNVYLVSRLDDELVEDLGILPVAPAEVSRLAVHYPSCIVLANAPLATAHPRGERRNKPRPARRKSRP